MKKIYTLFFSLFLFAGVSAFAQTNEEIDLSAKLKTREFIAVLQLNNQQQTQIFAVIKKYEENSGDYNTVTSPYPQSKFSAMRKGYATEILPEIKEILTTAQFEQFSQYLQP